MAIDFFKIGKAGAPKFTDIGGMVGKGLQQGLQPIFDVLEARKKEAEKTDGIVRQYLSKLPNVNSISKIPSWMRPTAEKYLFEEKNKYNKLANELAKMKSSDPAYMDIQGEMQGIVNNMVYFNDNIIAFQEESKDFVDLSDKGEISQGYKTGQSEEYAKAAGIFTGNMPLSIVEGELIFLDDKNRETINFSQGQLKEFYKTDFDINNILMKLEEKMKQDASRGYSWDQVENYYKAAISNALGTGGEDRLYSMVYDKDAELVTGRGFETPEIVNFLNKKDISKAREAIAKELETAFISTYNSLRGAYLGSQQAGIANQMQDISSLLNNISDLKTAEDYTKYFKNSKFNGKDVLNARIVDGPAGKQTGLNRLGRGKTKPVLTLTLAMGQKATEDFSFDLSNRNQQENLFKGIVKSRYSSGSTQDLAMQEIRKLLDQTFSNDLPIFN